MLILYGIEPVQELHGNPFPRSCAGKNDLFSMSLYEGSSSSLDVCNVQEPKFYVPYFPKAAALNILLD